MRKKIAIGYIRGRKFGNKWAPDRKEQHRQLSDFAEFHRYDLIEVHIDDQKDGLLRRSGLRGFGKAIEACRDKKADLLYIDTGRWRRNKTFLDFVSIHRKQSKTGPAPDYRMIAIPAEQVTIDAIQRMARYEKFYESNRIKKKKLTTAPPQLTPTQKWKLENGITTRKFRNFVHLRNGVNPIYILLEKAANAGKSMSEIADLLNETFYLTVDGKRWNRHNVRKTIDLIASEDFEKFLTLCNELADDSEYRKWHKHDVRMKKG